MVADLIALPSNAVQEDEIINYYNGGQSSLQGRVLLLRSFVSAY